MYISYISPRGVELSLFRLSFRVYLRTEKYVISQFGCKSGTVHCQSCSCYIVWTQVLRFLD